MLSYVATYDRLIPHVQNTYVVMRFLLNHEYLPTARYSHIRIINIITYNQIVNRDHYILDYLLYENNFHKGAGINLCNKSKETRQILRLVE